MKITGKKTVVLCTVISLIAFGSCQMFTTSLGKGFARDQTKQLEKASSGDLATTLATATDSDTSRAILEVLADKPDAEIEALSNEQKATVLNTALDATVSIQDLKDQALALLKQGESGKGEETSTKDIIKSICNAVNAVDTGAIVTILNGDISNVDSGALANASLALVAQVAKATDVTQVMENFETKNADIDTILTNAKDNPTANATAIPAVVEAILGADASEASKDNLTAAINTMAELNKRAGAGEEVMVLGVLDIGELLNSLQGK
jgi:hypothetical protein